MEQNLALFLPLEYLEHLEQPITQLAAAQAKLDCDVASSNQSTNISTTEAHPGEQFGKLDFNAILRGIERHAHRIYAQPNGRADKLEQLANLFIGSSTALLATIDSNEWDSSDLSPNPLGDFSIQTKATISDRHEFLGWLFDELGSVTRSIIQTSATPQESVVQFSLFLEETANSLEEYANRYGTLSITDEWSL